MSPVESCRFRVGPFSDCSHHPELRWPGLGTDLIGDHCAYGAVSRAQLEGWSTCQ
jgi:hypothetical protein